MNLGKVIGAPARYRLWVPTHLGLIAADLLGTGRQSARSHGEHLRAAVEWLCRAQDVRIGCPDGGGVSAGWSFEDGWLPSYPETSGYIVETFLAAARILDRPPLRDRSQRILDWELAIQNADGSFPGHFGEASSRPVVFNTGQIMHGMVAGYLELGRADCLEAAVRAGRWLVQSQDADGCWRRNVHNGVPHTYNTRAAWALLRTAMLAGEPALQEAAEKNIGWALQQQSASGWFATNAFVPGRAPFTHTIAYAIRGILESGRLLGREQFVVAARKAAAALAQGQRADGWLAGTYDDGWRPAASYCCLTGLAQTAIIWQRLARLEDGNAMSGAAERALDYLKCNHRISGDGSPFDGGVAGSAPIWGRYSMFEYPNWAAKFLADALMMAMADVAVPPDAGNEAD
ncbi:MAG: prenyltransferase/squalene oxidase repeat-containing protein [Gammaproteobacteria bacterium]